MMPDSGPTYRLDLTRTQLRCIKEWWDGVESLPQSSPDADVEMKLGEDITALYDLIKNTDLMEDL